MVGRSRIAWLIGIAVLASVGQAIPLPAGAEVPVDVELVLAIDSSDSVNPAEYALQIGGLVDAFRDPAVQRAITGGPAGAIAVSLVEWSGRYQQTVQIPWTRLDGPDAAASFAQQVGGLRRAFDEGVTSISGAIDFAASQFEGSGYVGTRRIIDISSDGVQNQGRRIDLAREAALARNITINALVILNEMPDLDEYFRERVIGGFGAFVIAANDYPDYPEAIKRKLIEEIGQTPIGRVDGVEGQVAILPSSGPSAAVR